MSDDDIIRLRHMLDAAREAMDFLGDRSVGALKANRMLLLAIVKDLEVIGEAAARLPASTQLQLPNIPWPDVIGMRHRLVHAYYDIDVEVVWQTVAQDLPPLVQQLRAALDTI